MNRHNFNPTVAVALVRRSSRLILHNKQRHRNLGRRPHLLPRRVQFHFLRKRLLPDRPCRRRRHPHQGNQMAPELQLLGLQIRRYRSRKRRTPVRHDPGPSRRTRQPPTCQRPPSLRHLLPTEAQRHHCPRLRPPHPRAPSCPHRTRWPRPSRRRSSGPFTRTTTTRTVPYAPPPSPLR